jgi:hypothetical protein
MLQERVSAETLKKLKEGIRGIWCKTKFEFVIFNMVTTKIKSGDFKYGSDLFNSSFYR